MTPAKSTLRPAAATFVPSLVMLKDLETRVHKLEGTGPGTSCPAVELLSLERQTPPVASAPLVVSSAEPHSLAGDKVSQLVDKVA